MRATIDMRILGLLTARVCHELSGPLAAVSNGAELLGEDAPEFSCQAISLIAESARRAANRLQFYRFAYGFSGDGAPAGPSPFELATRVFQGTTIACDYAERVRALPPDRQKLGCNLLLVGAAALGRGGRLALDIAGTGLSLEAVGETASLAPDQISALRLEARVGAITAPTVHAYFTALVARAQGLSLVEGENGPGRVRLRSIGPGA